MIRKESFDCVEMMHEGQRRMRKCLAGLSREDKLEYFRRLGEEARVEQNKLKTAGAATTGR